jgi:stearoyl-CoA desaturase (delta-9 desaturase)
MSVEQDSIAEVAAKPRRSLALPEAIHPLRLEWLFVLGIGSVHVLALLAFLPWFFSWTGLILCALGIYVFGTLGINLGFHRLLTHRSFSLPKWLERTLVVLGTCCLQDSPARWVSIHRRHHQFADERVDPHSPLVSFLWAHVGWVLVQSDDLMRKTLFDRYARDIMEDPFYAWLERYHLWWWTVFASWCLFFFGGFFAELLMGGTAAQALQFGLSLLVWGVFVRTVIVWHITWSVNSATHLWGYRNYETEDDSRNNVFVGIISNGEGWHNNHHADQRSARHGHLWWELDVAWLTIRALAMLGLATNVILPRQVPASPPRKTGQR